MVDDALQLCEVGVLVLFVQCCLQLLDGQETIGVGVDLLEEKAQTVNILFGQLSCDEGDGKGFELHQ